MYRRSFFERFKNLDLFPKYVETASVKTEIGAFLTLLSYLFLILLFMNELFLFLTLKLETNLTIDDSRIHNQVAVHFNITFPRLSCKLLHIDALDHSGARHLNIKHDIFTIPLDRKGNRKEHHKPKKLDKLGNGRFFCGSCYDAEEFSQDGCCNTCKEIETAYRKKGLSFNANDFEICDKNLKKEMKYEKDDGCIIYGTLHVNKIAGIFHIAPGVNSIYEDQHYHIYETKDDEKKIDCSHYIDYLYFGKAFSETLYPLSNTKQEDKAKGKI
ncbi:endoplasmic reticulum-golgi intermediate compartment protein [Anaeramoeba flamelloides]|uniref:Endoplasmic reticulum-golgi intermediate compartment protein n=1 Tax=Anaeramoeba flamelloides TaxID=1746091 RepID=A0ABQ8YPQ3_9EUKA|nr:endoplasmic reticulum-golgi intermediate compartment protein [Anaeramoeba flamelloides]